MQVDVSFSVGRVYNVARRIDVVQGEAFSLDVMNLEGTVHWFSDNDPVLDMVVTGNAARIVAQTPGTSIIQLQAADFSVVKVLEIRVVTSVDQAEQLNTTAGGPVLKG